MTQDPLRTACWRFEHISPLLDDRLTGFIIVKFCNEFQDGLWITWLAHRSKIQSYFTLVKWEGLMH